MSDLSINYSLTNLEMLTFPFVSTYGLRHLEKEGWLNKVIGAIELFPILGPIVALIERAVVFIFQNSQENQNSSAILSQASSTLNHVSWIQEFKKRALEHFAVAKINASKPMDEISLTPENEILIKTVINELNKGNQGENVTVHSANGIWVFSVKEIPNLIFKCGKGSNGLNKNELAERLFATDKARQVIEEQNLYLLRTPQQKFFELNLGDSSEKILIEQKFDILPSFDAQRSLFQYCVNDPDLKPFIQECAKQLITLIIKTGYSDVRYDNNPILSNGQGLCLIDMDTTNSPTIGLSCGKTRQQDDGILRYLSFDILKGLEEELKTQLTEEQFDDLNFSQILEDKKSAVERNEKFTDYLNENNTVTCKESVKLQGWTLVSTEKSKFATDLQETINDLALSNLGLYPVEERKFCLNMRANENSKNHLDQLKEEKKIFDWTPTPGFGLYVWA